MTIYLEISENEFVRPRETHAPAVKSDDLVNIAYNKRCEIGCKSVLFTRRKSHTGFRLAYKNQ